MIINEKIRSAVSILDFCNNAVVFEALAIPIIPRFCINKMLNRNSERQDKAPTYNMPFVDT